jgi:hypothetical protein
VQKEGLQKAAEALQEFSNKYPCIEFEQKEYGHETSQSQLTTAPRKKKVLAEIRRTATFKS